MAVTGPSLVGHECAHSLQVIRQLPRLSGCAPLRPASLTTWDEASVPTEVGVSHPWLPGSHHCLQLSFIQTYTRAHDVRLYIPYHTPVLYQNHRSQPAETDNHSQLRKQSYQNVTLQRTTQHLSPLSSS